MNLVSIIIPAYNCEHFIAEALDSALAQTYTNYEILIVNDGSTDATSHTLERYASRYPRVIRLFRQEQQGAAAARNKALKESTGEYIAFLDADDIWYPEKLRKQIFLLEAENRGFVYCDNHFVNETRGLFNGYIRKVSRFTGNIAINLFCDHFLMTPAVVLRRECLEKTGYFDESLRVGEDYDFFLKLANSHTAGFVNEKLWERRVIKNSLSRQDPELDMNNDLIILQRFIRDNGEFYRANTDAVNMRLADCHFSSGYRYLENGLNRKGCVEFLRSLYYRVSYRTLRNLIFCLVPFSARLTYKKYAQS